MSTHLRLVDRSDKVAHIVCFLVNDSTDQLAYTLELVVIHVSTTHRRPEPFAPDVAIAMDTVLTAQRALTWSAPTTPGVGVRRSASVGAWQAE